MPFRPAYQDEARRLILDGLGEHWGRIDEQINTDLADIAASYASGHFVLGWIGDSLVATGALVSEDDHSMRIVRMSVARAFRRRGLGRQLLDHLIEIARRLKVKRIVLETTETWAGVIAFYESYGFRVDEHRHGDAHMSLDLEYMKDTEQPARRAAASRAR